MREYLISVMSAGIVTGIIKLLFSDKSSESIGKYIRLLSSILMICVLAAPLGGIIKGLSEFKPEDYSIELPDFEKMSDEYDAYIIENARRSLGDQLCSMIFERTGIKPDTCRIEFSVEKKEEKINVKVSSVLIACDRKIEGIEEYVSELTGCAKENVVFSVIRKERGNINE